MFSAVKVIDREGALWTGGHPALHGARGAGGRRQPARLRDGAETGGHVRHGAGALGAGRALLGAVPGPGRAALPAAIRGRDRSVPASCPAPPRPPDDCKQQ